MPKITGIVTDVEALRRPCERVESTQEANRIIQKLWKALEYYGGVGLAAPQIGIYKQVCVAHSMTRYALVNPVITFASAAQETLRERCLSLPGVEVEVARPILIEVEADNFKDRLTFDIEKPINFKGVIRQLRHWGSFVVQHEIDHLNGRLILDYQKQEEIYDSQR